MFTAVWFSPWLWAAPKISNQYWAVTVLSNIHNWGFLLSLISKDDCSILMSNDLAWTILGIWIMPQLEVINPEEVSASAKYLFCLITSKNYPKQRSLPPPYCSLYENKCKQLCKYILFFMKIDTWDLPPISQQDTAENYGEGLGLPLGVFWEVLLSLPVWLMQSVFLPPK